MRWIMHGRVMRDVLARIQGAVLRYPRRVVAAAAVLVAVALYLGWGVEFQTSRRQLAPADDPDQQRMDRLVAEFDGSAALVVAVQAAPGAVKEAAELREFIDVLARAFRRSPLVAQVFSHVDLDWYLERGFWLVPPDALQTALEALREERPLLDSLATVRSLEDLNDSVARRLGSGLAQAAGPPEAEAAEGVRNLAEMIRAEARFLEDPAAFLDELEDVPPLMVLGGSRPELASRGYLSTRNGDTFFIFVMPADRDDSLPVLRAFIGMMREIATDAVGVRPGFLVAFTGEPATTVEEMDTVRRDTWFSVLVAVVGVALLTLLVFRWKSHSVMVLLALATGLALAFGAVRIEYGYLNLITSSFLSTLVGVGVAYGIHPVSEYELCGAHTSNPREAVREAYHRTGAAVTVAAVTTAAAFFSILLMRFRGFSELGLVAGVGVLLCLLSAMLVLPALLTVHGHWRRVRDTRRRRETLLDRLWVERSSRFICLYPRAVVAAALGLTAVCIWAAWGIQFNTNILDLLPRNAESVHFQREMINRSDLSPLTNMVVADDLETLRAMEERAAGERTIDRFESVLQFLPRDLETSRSTLLEVSGLLDDVSLPAETRRLGRGGLVRSFQRLEETFVEASDAAFATGYADLAVGLEEARAEAERARGMVEAAPEALVRSWQEGQERLLAWANRALQDLQRAAGSEAPSPRDLPQELQGRFLTRTGRFVAFLHPGGDIFDRGFLPAYSAASRRVSAEATGFPIVFYQMSRRITRGFYRAVAVGFLMVLLILIIDYRRWRDACLAMIPLVMGMVWMMGGMRLLGIDFNFANLVAVPLIIGVGIDNGVHVIHRVRLEGERGMAVVLRHTVRAILIASLTTMIGFGSLALASHRGMASLGLVLLLGVGACLITSTVVLPNLLLALGILKR